MINIKQCTNKENTREKNTITKDIERKTLTQES